MNALVTRDEVVCVVYVETPYYDYTSCRADNSKYSNSTELGQKLQEKLKVYRADAYINTRNTTGAPQ